MSLDMAMFHVSDTYIYLKLCNLSLPAPLFHHKTSVLHVVHILVTIQNDISMFMSWKERGKCFI